MTPGEKQAQLDGQVARLRGLPLLANPFVVGTTHSRFWARAHRKAGAIA